MKTIPSGRPHLDSSCCSLQLEPILSCCIYYEENDDGIDGNGDGDHHEFEVKMVIVMMVKTGSSPHLKWVGEIDYDGEAQYHDCVHVDDGGGDLVDVVLDDDDGDD